MIEHVHRKEELLSIAASLLKPNGLIYVGFPAWQMPFGGHQQIAHTKFISYFPFIHLLPATLYKSMLKKAGETEDMINELLDIKTCGTSIEKFKSIVKNLHLTLEDEIYYFINPHYKAKFGLKPRKLSPLFSSIPGIRNFLTTSYFCILSL